MKLNANSSHERMILVKFNEFKKQIAFLAAVAVLGTSIIIPASAEMLPPSNPTSTDSNVIKVAGSGATGVMLEMLGGNLVGADAVHLSTAKMPLFMPVFGTDNNDTPDPYLYNAFYNTAVTDDEKVENASQTAYQSVSGPGALITEADSDGIIPMLKFRPDFIIGSSTDETLKACIDAVPDEENYNPVLGVGQGMADPEQIMATIKSFAEGMQSVIDNSDEKIVGRYGDPADIAEDFCEFYNRTMNYCEEKVASLNKEKVKVINVTGISSSEWAVQYGGAEDIYNRYIEKAGGTPIGQEDLVMTTHELTQADILLASNNDIKTELEKAFDSAGYSSSEIPSIYVTPRGVYGWQLRSPEGALTVPWLTSIFYPELANNEEINPVYTTAYFYKKYYHYTGKLEELIGTVLTSNSLPESLSVDLSDWDDTIIPGVEPATKEPEENESSSESSSNSEYSSDIDSSSESSSNSEYSSDIDSSSQSSSDTNSNSSTSSNTTSNTTNSNKTNDKNPATGEYDISMSIIILSVLVLVGGALTVTNKKKRN